MGSFSFSFLDEKTSEALLCLQKAVSLFLAAATSEVEESSCLLYAAGSSSIVFKDFKVPETEVQQCYDTSSRKTRWQIFRSTFFVLCNAGKQKNLQKPKPYCSSANKMHSLLSYSSQNVIWSAWSKSVPKSSNLLVKKPWHYIKCHLFLFFFFFLHKSQKTFDLSDKLDMLALYECWKVCLYPNWLCSSACFPVPCVLCWLVSKSFFNIWIQSAYFELKLSRVVLHGLYFYITQVCV